MRYILALILCAMSVSTAYATTYYTKKTGSDANTCGQAASESTPKLTIAGGMGCLAAGDTLIVGDGTYTEAMLTTSMSGGGVSGTVSNRITIEAQNRRAAIIAPGGSATRGLLVHTSYITVSGFSFNCDSSAGGDNSSCFTNSNTSNTNVWLIDNEFYDGPGGGVYAGGSSSNFQILSNEIHGNGRSAAYGVSNGMYISALDDSLIAHNEIYNNECNGIRVGNSGTTGGGADRNTVEYNYIHDNGDGFSSAPLDCTSDAAGIMVGDSDNVIRYNVITNQFRGGIWFYNLSSSNPDADNVAYNNTIYNVTHYGIRVHSSHTGVIYRNNHIASATLGATFHDVGGSTVVSSNNRTTGSITDCTVSTSDFTQKTGSACIDAGSTLTALSYNGSAPDIGAFETFVFSACEVPSGAATTIRATWINNTNPPILPASSVTGLTGRKNAASNTITASARVGDGQIDFTTTNTYIGGDTADISATSTNITDSALIGGTLNQPWIGTLTNESCTNNISGESYTFTQADYEFRYPHGTEAGAIVLPWGNVSAENFAGLKMRVGGELRIRFSVVCSGGCPDTAFYLYSYSGGGYELVPDTFSTQDVAFCGTTIPDIPENGSPTTAQLSTAGTFRSGGFVATANAIPTVTGFGDGDKTELEYCVKFDTDATGSKSFRLGKQDGSTLTYTNTATISITADAAGGSGF